MRENISRLLNQITGGDPTELLCSRVYRQRRWFWVTLLDALLGRKHCEISYRYERRKRGTSFKQGSTGSSQETPSAE